MKIVFKPEVRLLPTNLEPEIMRMLQAAVRTAPALHGGVLVVTSAADGTHKTGSLHYAGRAWDLRILGNREGAIAVPEAQQLTMARLWAIRLRALLGTDYDVVVESDHIHLEYDPK